MLNTFKWQNINVPNSVGLKVLEKIRIYQVLKFCRGRVLDIGCGYNNLIRNYPGEGIGIDVYPWEGVDIVVNNSSRLTMFREEEFNTVCFVASLNHIPYRMDALSEAYRVLKKDGLLIITMIPSNIGKIWHFITEPFWGEGKKRKIQKGESGGLSHQMVIDMLKKCNFQLQKISQFQLGLNRIYLAKKGL